MSTSAIKDISPDDIFYMTWLIECIEYDNNGDPYVPVYHDTICQDYYNPQADYILSQKANDDQLIGQIDRLWCLESSSDYPDYSTISAYLKELAIKYVHKKCVRFGTKNIHQYFEDWIEHTVEILRRDGDYLSNIVYSYDIDELVKMVHRELKLYAMLLYKPETDKAIQVLRVRLKDFFATEQSVSDATKKTTTLPVPELQEILYHSTKYEKFILAVEPYKFSELEKVKCLRDNQRIKLICLIIGYKTPKAVAMLHFLEFSQKLETEYGKNKGQQYLIISKALDVSDRTIRGNMLTFSNPNSNEDRSKYPACDKLPDVTKDYESICKRG
ncbi:hypothetical protein [Parabacteroides sp. FAFU027]|uniref:hypothetical protein n=1 Tax=Parabacteroides sp. FAFU027 TaxID=2922715 RepID=UPI001FAECD0C|nr:hypothetical protein [Parabacteroides sp. FAFU027]